MSIRMLQTFIGILFHLFWCITKCEQTKKEHVLSSGVDSIPPPIFSCRILLLVVDCHYGGVLASNTTIRFHNAPHKTLILTNNWHTMLFILSRWTWCLSRCFLHDLQLIFSRWWMQQLKAFSFQAGHLYIDDSTYHDLKSLWFKTISRRRVNGLMQIFHFNGSMFSFFLLKKMPLR